MGAINKQRVEELKKQYRVVLPVEVEDDGEVYSCYLKRPSVETLGIVNKLAKTDEVKAAAVLLTESWIEGDQEIRSDGILMLAVAAELGKANSVRASVIKN
jgi:hypothetical protein